MSPPTPPTAGPSRSSEEGKLVIAKGRAAIEIDAQPFGESPADLEAIIRKSVIGPNDAAAAPKQVTFGNDIPGVAVAFATTTSKGVALDGIYVVGVRGGVGVVLFLFAAQGQLQSYTDDADAVLGSITIGGGE